MIRAPWAEQERQRLWLRRVRAIIRAWPGSSKRKLPLEVARKLLGPDCAYHLYFRRDPAAPALRALGRRRRGRGLAA